MGTMTKPLIGRSVGPCACTCKKVSYTLPVEGFSYLCLDVGIKVTEIL